MPKKKNEEVVVVESHVNKLSGDFMIEKAKPLAVMQNMPFSLGEFKVLDTYLSRINARDDTHRTVRFSIEEYEKLMGISRMRSERMGKYIDSMMGKLVTIENPDNPKEWRKFVLFGASRCYRDEKTKQWWIELTCTEEAKELFFALENVGYFRYYLSSITSLNSIYTYYLYLYLIKNDFRGKWKEEVADLKRQLCCTAEAYDDFRYFKRDILEKALKEVNAKTDIQYEYTTVKKAQRVVAIEFHKIKKSVGALREPIPLDEFSPEQYIQPEDMATEAEKKYKDDEIQFLSLACDIEFNEEEMIIIKDLLNQIIPGYKYHGTERYDYLMRKYHELNMREKKMKEKGEQMNSRFAYFKKMIEADVPLDIK